MKIFDSVLSKVLRAFKRKCWPLENFSRSPASLRPAYKSRNDSRLLKAERLDLKTEDLLKNAVRHHALSGRAIHRILKVSRTLADLEAKPMIEANHLMEALQYRIKS